MQDEPLTHTYSPTHEHTHSLLCKTVGDIASCLPNFSLSLSLSLSVFLPVCLSICLFVCLSVSYCFLRLILSFCPGPLSFSLYSSFYQVQRGAAPGLLLTIYILLLLFLLRTMSDLLPGPFICVHFLLVATGSHLV
jgi:hypothetical protein